MYKLLAWLLLFLLKPAIPTSRGGFFLLKQAGISYWIKTMNLNLYSNQNVVFTFADSSGNVAPPGTVVNWTVSNSEVGSIVPAEGGITAEFVTTGALGVCTVSAVGVSGVPATAEVTVVFNELLPQLLAGEPYARTPPIVL